MGFLPIPVESSYGNMYVCELCDQTSVLLEDCLLGEEDRQLFLMFSITEIWQLSAPKTGCEVQGGLGVCCWEQRCCEFQHGQQKDPSWGHPEGRV